RNMKERYDRNREQAKFKVGDKVWKKIYVWSGKFAAKKEGPFIITKEVRLDVWKLEDDNGRVIDEVNGSNLELCYTKEGDKEQSEEEEVEEIEVGTRSRFAEED